MDQLKLIADFLRTKNHAVIVTVTAAGQPQAAIVGVSHHEGLKLVFATQDKTRKYRNLRHNAKAAAVVGLSYPITVQLDGTARILAGSEKQRLMQAHFEQRPGSKAYADWPGQNYLIFEPTWVRYTDIGQGPEFIIEKTLNAD